MTRRLKGFRVITCDLCGDDYDDEPEDWLCEICGCEVCPECREMIFTSLERVICIHCGDVVGDYLAALWPETFSESEWQ
jgi:hypothetical protein